MNKNQIQVPPKLIQAWIFYKCCVRFEQAPYAIRRPGIVPRLHEYESMLRMRDDSFEPLGINSLNSFPVMHISRHTCTSLASVATVFDAGITKWIPLTLATLLACPTQWSPRAHTMTRAGHCSSCVLVDAKNVNEIIACTPATCYLALSVSSESVDDFFPRAVPTASPISASSSHRRRRFQTNE